MGNTSGQIEFDAVFGGFSGRVRVTASDGAITAVELLRSAPAGDTPAGNPAPLLADAQRQITEFFAGTRDRFDLPVAPAGTAFQLAVWRATADVPRGATTTYGEIARRVGRPAAARAVGRAMGANPVPLLVPCHRVLGADGSLTGFSSGIAWKRALLAMEALPRAYAAPPKDGGGGPNR